MIALTALLWHNFILVFAVSILVVMALCSLLKYKNAGRLGGVTVAIIVLIPYSGPMWQIAIERFVEVSFGIVVPLGVALAWTRSSRLIHAAKT